MTTGLIGGIFAKCPVDPTSSARPSTASRVVAIIPARFAATRFPGKLLADRTGKYLIQHVFESVRACASFDRVIVAADDERIVRAVESFGGDCLLTRSDHTTGTDRVGEVAQRLKLDADAIVVNVQGDEPDLEPADLARLVEQMQAWKDVAIGTLATPFPDDGPSDGPLSAKDPNCVKVVVDADHRALYFSRSLIPYPRATDGDVGRGSNHLLHVGVYAFRASMLLRITVDGGLPRGALERVESLEQLRWLEHGITIGVVRAQRQPLGIDTEEDYAEFVRRYQAHADAMG